MPFPGLLRWLRASSLTIYRLLTWSVLVAGFACAATVIGLRYWVLPNIGEYREQLAGFISEAAGQRVTIGRISGNWDGLRPELVLEDVTVHDRAGQPALTLTRVENTLSWLSFPALEPRFYSLEIRGPALAVQRDSRGVVSVAGIEFAPDHSGGFADWLLRQREIVVRDATVSWLDEKRGAAPLELKHVDFLLRNRSNRHRFGLRATPPPHLASPLDVRGELRGDSVSALVEWNGRLFVQFDYADIAAWRSWLEYPIDVNRGAGALRAWFTFSRNALADVTADVHLVDLDTRLARDLPALEVTAVSGRLGWKSSAAGMEFSALKLGLTTLNGPILPAADFHLLLAAGDQRTPARGELRANALALEPLVFLADRLPIDDALRKRLYEVSPKGSVTDLAMRWQGEWNSPQQYSLRGRFHELALNRSGDMPGFSGLSGSIDGNERTGTLHLNSAKSTLDLPAVFRDPLSFDTVVAQLAWSRAADDLELRLSNVSFSNEDVAGTLFGTYRAVPARRGVIDLTGNLTRADARRASRYVPLLLGESTRNWLDTAFPAGRSKEVALRLKGDLEDFPFVDGKGGVFQVTAKITDGVVDYAQGWPRIENVTGDLSFRGARMEVHARQGTILGAKLEKVRAEIPDLMQTEELLRVSGQAEGPTAEFLSFIEKSPVLGMIDRFTAGMRAQGSGRLALQLEIPLRTPAASKVSGSYQFIGNRLEIDPDLPPVEQVSGRLEFTESEVRVPAATAQFLGGPASVAGSTQPDGSVRVALQGRVNIDNVRRSAGSPWWTENLRGATDWKGALTLRKKLADLTIESSLLGVASNLPAPFRKAAGEVVPMRFERSDVGEQLDRVSVFYGDIASARFVRRIEGGRAVIARGAVRLGGGGVDAERDGIWISGSLGNLDFDRWRAFLRQGGDEAVPALAGIDVKVAEVTALGRPFHDVSVNAAAQGGIWQAALAAREFAGNAEWHPQGRGKLTARLKRLAIPAATAPTAGAESGGRGQELPGLDIVAEQFQFKNRPLGRLELLAVSEPRDWRIEKLRIANPDATLAAEGVVQNTASEPRTRIKLQLDTGDIGRLLTRLGYPEGVRRGTAKVAGSLAWAGAIQDFDYPGLSGNLTLDAAKGQFVKLEPGIGKLLGILSLQALPRRITLDFRDVFSEGFAFDEIAGAIRINRGIATTENFRIQGPAAAVSMSGDIDLARETQALRVRITPSLTESVAVAGALIGGPVAGVAAFLAQKMLKDPLGQLVSYEYTVGGTWSDPQVSKIERPSASDADRLP